MKKEKKKQNLLAAPLTDYENGMLMEYLEKRKQRISKAAFVRLSVFQQIDREKANLS